MLQYTLRRLYSLVFILLGVSVVVFAMVHFSPGDPIRIMLGDDAEPAEVERLATLYETSHADYTAHPEEAARIAEEPLGPVPDRKQLSAYAAWTVVANVILNLDEIFMKR